ncbi:hypothetical protein [Nonomuraea rosea]
MKHRGAVILLALGVAAAGFMSMGLVRAAEERPELGGPVVVSSSPKEGVSTSLEEGASASPREGASDSPSPRRSEEPEPVAESDEPGSSPVHKSVPPSSHKTKAEPVKPPSPRPGGGDDDDDGGGDDDGDD